MVWLVHSPKTLLAMPSSSKYGNNKSILWYLQYFRKVEMRLLPVLSIDLICRTHVHAISFDKKAKSFLNLTSYKLSYQKLFSLICKSYYTSVILLPSSCNNIAIFQAITSFKSDHSHIIHIRKLYRDGVLLFEDNTKRTIRLQLI